MPKRNVNLTDHYNQFVEQLIDSGLYKDASEVMRAGLRLLERETLGDDEKPAALRTPAAEGFDALDRGDGTTLESEREVVDFIETIGKRAARRAARHSGGG